MSDKMLVTMERVARPDEPKGPYPPSVLIGIGHTANGTEVTFSGERNEMLILALGMADAASEGEMVRVVVEDWQVIRTSPGLTCACGHHLWAHMPPAAKREPWGECTQCDQCREAWPVEPEVQ